MPEHGDIVYQLNDRDEICFVNKEYDAFATANDGLNFTSVTVLHRPLWDFITDLTTRQLYRDVLILVRRGRPLRFNFRCDSPTCRRLMEMNIGCVDNGAVEYRIRTITESNRPSQLLLEPNIDRFAELLRVCSWCKMIHVGDGWVEAEDAITSLGLFERPTLPAITHGICEQCYQRMIETLS